MRLGLHVSISGGFCEALERAKELGCHAMQVFSRSPRNWNKLDLDKKDAEKFKKERIRLKIFPLVVHIPYLINLSSPNDRLYKRSIANFIYDIKISEAIGAEYFVTHLGSHKGEGERFGIRRFYNAINVMIKKISPKISILLETTAGSGDWLGYKFEHIRDILKGIDKRGNIGVCLDTAHAYGAGYDVATKEGLEKTLEEFDRLVGLERLKVIHLNDSKAELGSRVDRHEHIGKGRIGKVGMKLILNHPKLKDLTFILETPKQTTRSDRMNLAMVRKLAN